MRLKKLIIYGFKSFADRVEIEFEDGITGVVGPNGCGKSNIAEAVQWVLGEQSARSLRGAKMEDVIFNGTEKRRRLSFCEVTLLFDNSDHGLPIDFSEVSVTRRAYRSGEGEYKLNGTGCRLRDIVDLFRDTGIGRDGYSLVGQGRIDEILSAKSEDRRQVFEEAAGIVKFKARKSDAQHRMDNTSANLDRVEDILSELAGRVEPLRAQSETAREYLSLRDELKQLELNLFLLRGERYEARIGELQRGMEELDASMLAANRELEASQAEREQRQQELTQLEAAAAEKRESVQGLIRSVEACEGAVGVLRERIAALTKERDRLRAQCDAAGSGREDVHGRIAALTAQLQASESALSARTAQQEVQEAALAEEERSLAEMEERSERMKQQIIEEMNRLGDVRSQRARLSALQSALEAQLAKGEGERGHERDGVEALRAQVAEAQERLNEEEEHRQQLQAQTEEHNARVQALNDRLQALSQQVSQLQAQRQSAESRMKLLQEMQRDYEGYNNSVKQVLLQARRNPDAGVHGVIADLIRVPAKLERAIDMVLGGALQNIVVDRDEDAKRMIDYLRANHYGRATFLPIASVRARTLTAQERQVLSLPGCLGVASELLSFEGQYRGVVDSLLGRTVVAEDLDSAIAIQRAAHYQLRLVTLQGDVMHAGGSMTGGSVQSRMTSLLSRAREIEETEARCKAIDEQLAHDREIYQGMDGERSDLKRERGELYDALHAQEVLCGRADESLKAVLEEQSANDARLQRLEAEQERLRAQLEDVKSSLASLEEQQQSAQRTSDSRQGEVRKLQEEIYAKREANEALRRRVLEERVSLAESKRDLEGDRALLKRMNREAQDSAKQLEESRRQLEKSERELARCSAEVESQSCALGQERERLNAERAAFAAADESRVGAQERLRQIGDGVEEVRARLEEFSERRHRSELQLARMEGEYKQLQDRIWEDYQLTREGAESFRRQGFKLTEADRRITAIRARIRELGTVNVASVDEYRRTTERIAQLSGQRDDLLRARSDLEGIIAELERQMESRFREQFARINENFARSFTRLFGGGTAQLRLEDPNDALNCGIEIVAQPPGKKLQMLSLLSGGERALTAIAILFAILDLKPTPFCVLDEIEAALDDANIDTYADYLKSYSQHTQFIVITHRKGTMERCDALYGVVMQEKGVSRTVSVKLNDPITNL